MVIFLEHIRQVRGTRLFVTDKGKGKLPPGETVKVSRGTTAGSVASPARGATAAFDGRNGSQKS